LNGTRSIPEWRKFTPVEPTLALKGYILETARLQAVGGNSLEGFNAALKESVDGSWRGIPITEFSQHLLLLQEMIYARTVENFQNYVYEIMKEVFVLRPEMVPNRKIDSREIFESSSIDDVRIDIITRAVLEFSYMNLVDFTDDLDKKFGFQVLHSKFEKAIVRRCVAVRNSIAHERGFVTTRLLQVARCKKDVIGKKIRLSHPSKLSGHLIKIAVRTDAVAQSKFGVLSFGPWSELY
jgi:hypothetical protein